MAKWFYHNESGEKIEVTGAQLMELAQAGTITPDTIVETGEGKTAPARNVKNLVFSETTQAESMLESSITEPNLTTDIPLESETSVAVSAPTAEHSENHSLQESDSEPVQCVAELVDALLPSAAGETVESEPTPDVTGGILSELKPMLTALEEKLETLTHNVDFGTKFAEKKQEQIDKLYEENQKYKEGIHEKLKKSLVLAVIGQIDAAQKTISHFGNQEFSEENYRKLLNNYGEIATDFQDSLAQSFDVTAFSSEENTPFDAKRQRALKTVSTEDETRHKTISKSLRQGYEIVNADGTTTLLRLEMVEVYVHQSPQGEQTTETN